MRILLVGASGVLGRALLPHLQQHEVVGTTRSIDKVGMLRSLSAIGAVCDVYEQGALERLALDFRPELVVNLLTDLATGPGPSNARIRREGGPLVVSAARAAGANKLVVESISFPTPVSSAEAVTALEQSALSSDLAVWILRFGRFWGPGTWDVTPPAGPRVHVQTAGRLAAETFLHEPPGLYRIDDDGVSPP